MNTVYIISHWDIDGIVSAALIARSTNITKTRITKIRLSTISALNANIMHALNKSFYIQPFTNFVIIDLNPPQSCIHDIASLLLNAIEMGINVYWIDHHVWDPNNIEILKSIGVKIYLDQNKVSAEIVRDLVGLDDMVSNTLVELAKDDDLFLNRFPYTVKLRRILRWYDWSIRYRVLKSFINGSIWPIWAEKLYTQISDKYESLLDEVVKNYTVHDIKGTSVVVVKNIDPRLHPGEVQDKLEKNGVIGDLYILVYPTAISLRSDTIDVSRIALALGGGGHQKAAGITNTIDIDHVLDVISNFLGK
ncbi:MAG: phosphohydrolase [Thermoprotei archaeon]|nr:MAG: phosphohydrolase [Thermoprotei archaeon]